MRNHAASIGLIFLLLLLTVPFDVLGHEIVSKEKFHGFYKQRVYPALPQIRPERYGNIEIYNISGVSISASEFRMWSLIQNAWANRIRWCGYEFENNEYKLWCLEDLIKQRSRLRIVVLNRWQMLDLWGLIPEGRYSGQEYGALLDVTNNAIWIRNDSFELMPHEMLHWVLWSVYSEHNPIIATAAALAAYQLRAYFGEDPRLFTLDPVRYAALWEISKYVLESGGIPRTYLNFIRTPDPDEDAVLVYRFLQRYGLGEEGVARWFFSKILDYINHHGEGTEDLFDRAVEGLRSGLRW